MIKPRFVQCSDLIQNDQVVVYLIADTFNPVIIVSVDRFEKESETLKIGHTD